MARNKFTISSVSEDLHDARLPDVMGTAGQVPKINSAGDGFEYGTISGGMENPMTAAGDIIVGGTGGNPTRVAHGTGGQVLVTNDNGAILWKTPTECVVKDQGVAYAGKYLAVGNDGLVTLVDAPSGGFGWPDGYAYSKTNITSESEENT